MIAKKAERRRARARKKALRAHRRKRVDVCFVDHPRYGDRPILSGERWTEQEVRQAFWRYGSQGFLPETAISANIAKQKYCCCPRRVYVDIIRRCRTCRRPFIFFALEQKHWFETLGFHVDADCLHCQECRHEKHLFREALREYEALRGKEPKTRAEWARLAELADALYSDGYISKPETLLKSRIPRRLRKIL